MSTAESDSSQGLRTQIGLGLGVIGILLMLLVTVTFIFARRFASRTI